MEDFVELALDLVTFILNSGVEKGAIAAPKAFAAVRELIPAELKFFLSNLSIYLFVLGCFQTRFLCLIGLLLAVVSAILENSFRSFRWNVVLFIFLWLSQVCCCSCAISFQF
jgi:hypothetical protein